MNPPRLNLVEADAPAETLSYDELRALEAEYCSYGDTVHYVEEPKFFESCDGSYLYDEKGTPFLDTQMWYSTANFGYRNPRLNAFAKRQLDRLPQVASQYLHREKVELAADIAQDAQRKFGIKGRVHFNVGGAQAIDDSLKLIRNYCGGKSLMFAMEGSYHGRTIGASSITSSYRYRRRFGHFGDRAQFIEFPHWTAHRDMDPEEHGEICVRNFARLFENEFNGVWDAGAKQCEYAALYVEPVQGTGGGFAVPPKNFYKNLKKVTDQYGIVFVADEIKVGMYRTGKRWAIEHFDVSPDVMVFGKAITNGLNPLSGLWAREEMINPKVFPPGATHSTFSSNVMGTSIALETLRMAEEEHFTTTVPQKGERFLNGLKDIQKRHAIVGHVDGLGLALHAEIVKPDGITPDRDTLNFLCAEGLKGDMQVDGKPCGLVLDVGGRHKNVITFCPALTISNTEIDHALRMFDELLTRAEKR